nr:hypothetical protein [uncultured Oscillibacter sp.]
MNGQFGGIILFKASRSVAVQELDPGTGKGTGVNMIYRRNIDCFQRAAIREGSGFNVLQDCRQDNVVQPPAVCEGIVSYLINAIGQQYGLEKRTTVERACANSFNPAFHIDGGQFSTSVKCVRGN